MIFSAEEMMVSTESAAEVWVAGKRTVEPGGGVRADRDGRHLVKRPSRSGYSCSTATGLQAFAQHRYGVSIHLLLELCVAQLLPR